MDNDSPDILTESVLKEHIIPRKKLLPVWIRVFSWIFLVLGCSVPVFVVIGIITHSFGASLYGLETNMLYSSGGLIIVALFLFKTVVAFGLLKYKDWVIKLGIVDALIGIVICFGVMLYQFTTPNNFMFRLELIALIPYLIKLVKIENDWNASNPF